MSEPTDMLDGILCWWCGHRAGMHLAHCGPCGTCWEEGRRENDSQPMCGKTICFAFIADDLAIAQLERLMEAANV